MHAPHHVTDMSQSPNQRRRTWALGGPWGAGRAHRRLGWQPESEGVPRGSPFPRGPHAAPADRFRGVWSHQHSQASVGATEHGRDLISLAGHLAAPARSRPPACHRHLASNSSRPDPTSAAPVGRPRSRKPRVRQQIAHGGRVGHREAGAAFQFQEESRLARRRGHSLAALTWGTPAAHGLEKTAPGAVGLPCLLTSVTCPEIRNGEGKPFHSKALSSRIAGHTVCRPRTT